MSYIKKKTDELLSGDELNKIKEEENLELVCFSEVTEGEEFPGGTLIKHHYVYYFKKD